MIETVNEKGQLHSFNDKPATEWDNGFKNCKEWYKNGKLHRDNKPACISVSRCYIRYSFYKNGLLHRVLKPARIELREGLKAYEAYYIKGRPHNPIGPSIIYYAPYYFFFFCFHIHGEKLFFYEFIKQLEERFNL